MECVVLIGTKRINFNNKDELLDYLMDNNLEVEKRLVFGERLWIFCKEKEI
jgi:hypothetical protein